MSGFNFKAKIFNLKKYQKLYHIGTLDISNKDINSTNGNGLSITINPNEWKELLHTNSNKLWSLYKDNINLIDYDSLTTEDFEISKRWALNHKYIKEDVKFEINIFNKKLGFNEKVKFNSLYEIHKEGYLNEEYENYEEYEFFKEYEDIDVKKIVKYIPTSKMTNLSMTILNEDNLDSIIMLLFLELNSDIDGVYWTEPLKIFNKFNSNGILFNSRVNSFKIKEVHFCSKCEGNIATLEIKDKFMCDECCDKTYKKDKLNKRTNYYTCGKCKKKFFYAFGKCDCYKIL